MNDNKTILPYTVVERIMKNAGTQRISESAVITMRNILEEYCQKLTKQAIILADHSGRVTIKGEDIKLAITRMK